jgi:predicted enzyme related to lactoylglutathione lyase
MQAPPDQPGAPFWNAYFATDDTDGAVAATEAAGGRVLMGPLDVPAGRIAVVMDPQGAAFSLFQGELDP